VLLAELGRGLHVSVRGDIHTGMHELEVRRAGGEEDFVTRMLLG
jgi:hypothetical protein